jgi:O-antigen/teichoic acid export membrane protein
LSRAKELSRSIGSTLGAQFLGLAFSLVFLAYFARVLPKSEIALYAFMATMVSWVELFRLGFPTLMLREVPVLKAKGQNEDARRLISGTVFYCALTGLLVSVAIGLLAPQLAEWVHGSQTYVVEFQILAVVTWAHAMMANFSMVQEALQRFHMRAACNVIINVGGRALAWVVFLQFGFRGFLWSFVVANVVVLFIQIWSMRHELTVRIMPFRRMFRRSRIYIGVNVLRNLMVNLDRPVVAFVLGDVALADYYVAKRLFDVVRKTARAVIAPPGIKLSEAKVEGTAATNSYLQKSMSLMTFLFVPAGFCMIAMGEPLLRLWVGSSYASSSGILICFGIAIMAQSVSQTWWQAVFRLTAARHLLVLTVLMAAVTFSMYAVLLPPLGPTGIPLSFACACVAASVYATVLLRREANIFVPTTIYWRALACGLVVWAAIAAARLLDETLLGYAAMAMAAVAGYGLGFLLFAPAACRELAQRVLKAILPRHNTVA